MRDAVEDLSVEGLRLAVRIHFVDAEVLTEVLTGLAGGGADVIDVEDRVGDDAFRRWRRR